MLIFGFQQFVLGVTLLPDSKPYQMKLIKKIAEAVGIFSPILILLFACGSYLSRPEKEKKISDDQVTGEVWHKRINENSSREDAPLSLNTEQSSVIQN